MIKVKNLTHYYNNDKALENINLEINKGEFICLVGESGSGKSTLLSIISTLLKPTKGELFFENLNYKNIKDIDDFRKTNIGFIFQFHYLINYLTVKENIKLANEKATENEIHNLLKILRIENLSNKYPNEISGGQRQRVSIARALINKPKVIIADEPTGNLDTYSTEVIWNLLQGINKNLGTTILLATHQVPNLSQLSFKHYNLHEGQCKNASYRT